MPATRSYYCLPSTKQVAEQIADARELTALALALLQSHPTPDSFAGRKTQEPFPPEKELQPLAEN